MKKIKNDFWKINIDIDKYKLRTIERFKLILVQNFKGINGTIK